MFVWLMTRETHKSKKGQELRRKKVSLCRGEPVGTLAGVLLKPTFPTGKKPSDEFALILVLSFKVFNRLPKSYPPSFQKINPRINSPRQKNHGEKSKAPAETEAFPIPSIDFLTYTGSPALTSSANFSKVAKNNGSSFREFSIDRCACITVVWSLPPKKPPISSKLCRVKLLARYMQICLGKAIDRLRFFD